MNLTEKDSYFADALNKLNKNQRLAVDTIEGPVMVVAGPGTGKTQILTLRIANILRQTDTKPEQILALTFTDSGVRAMRERLIGFIGQAAYKVPIYTFHSFAGDLIKRYPDAYEHIVGGRPATELEKIRLIEQILTDTQFKRLRPNGDPSYYVKPILQAIGTLKKEYVSPDDFALSIDKQAAALDDMPKLHEKGAHKGKVRGDYLDAEKRLEKNQELLQIYRLYKSAMVTNRWYDFEDMILDTITALETREDMRLDVQEQFLYILADEHQDVNQSQNRLIELIASYHENPNVFVVGDEKQAIYRFQGASLDNFLYFGDIYPGAKIIDLVDNYRSDQSILDLAHDSIKTDDESLAKLRVPLKAANKFAARLESAHFSHTVLEEAYVISQIESEIESGTNPSEISVIVRTNKEVELFTKLLRQKHIPVAPSADSDILNHPITLQVLNIIKLVVEPSDDSALVDYLHAPYSGVPVSDFIKLMRERSYARSLRETISDNSFIVENDLANPTALISINEWLSRVTAASVTNNPALVLEQALKESGLIDYVMKHDPVTGSSIVRRLYDEVEAMSARGEVSGLRGVYEQLVLLGDYGLSVTAPLLRGSW
jgi:DNA helicase II / ATP-dependent DNA helicase PcrA